MQRCTEDAAKEGEPLDTNGGDVKAVMNATQHIDERMIRSTYDRRKIVRAAAVGASRIPKLEYPKTKGVSP
jgi:hypothetical protein